MKDRILTLLGFAMKAKKIYTGGNTCELYIKRGIIKLLIIAEDAVDNTTNYMIRLCESNDVPYIIFMNRDTLSQAVGKSNRTVFGITDSNFAEKILEIYEEINGKPDS